MEVFNREYNLIMDKEHNLVAGSGYFANTSLHASRSLAPLAGFVGAEQSILQAIKELADINVSLTKSAEQGDYVKYNVMNQNGDKVVLGQPRAKKVFFEVNGKLESAYYVEVEVANKNSLESDYFSYVIGAQNSKVYFKKDLKAHAADFNYRVWADADGYPWEGPHGDVIPADGPDQIDELKFLMLLWLVFLITVS